MRTRSSSILAEFTAGCWFASADSTSHGRIRKEPPKKNKFKQQHCLGAMKFRPLKFHVTTNHQKKHHRNSQTIPVSLGTLMGVVWEAYHKGVPLLGVPQNPIDKGQIRSFLDDFFFEQIHLDRFSRSRRIPNRYQQWTALEKR